MCASISRDPLADRHPHHVPVNVPRVSMCELVTQPDHRAVVHRRACVSVRRGERLGDLSQLDERAEGGLREVRVVRAGP